MKTNTYKSAINSTSFDCFSEKVISKAINSNLSSELKDIKIDIYGMPINIIPYRLEHNRFVPEKVYLRMVKNTAFNAIEFNALTLTVNSAVPGNVSLELSQLHAYSAIISSQLASPEKWANHPILDKLHFTVKITRQEIDALIIDAKVIAAKAGFYLIAKPPKRKKNQYHETVLTFCSKEHKDAKIYFFLGDNAESRKFPVNLLRIEVNPARHSHTEFKCFFLALKQSGSITKYKQKMKYANVTRNDLAIDLLCCPLVMLIADKSSIKQNYSNHSKHDVKNCTHVQTVTIGNTERSYTTLYSKTEKILEARMKNKKSSLPLLLNGDLNPILVGRTEHKKRKQQDGGKLVMKDLDKKSNQNLVKSLRVYRPELLATVHENQQAQVLKDGYMVAMKKHDEAAFACREDFLKPFQMYINNEAFEKMQARILKKAKNYIIYPDKKPVTVSKTVTEI
jgi:hypothetical protein